MVSKFPVFHYDNPEAILRWPREFIYEADLYPLTRRPFGPHSYPTPRYPLGYLLRSFGLNVFDVFIVPDNHDNYRPRRPSSSEEVAELPRGVEIPLVDHHFLPVLPKVEDDDAPVASVVRGAVIANLRALAVQELRKISSSDTPWTQTRRLNDLRHWLSIS